MKVRLCPQGSSRGAKFEILIDSHEECQQTIYLRDEDKNPLNTEQKIYPHSLKAEIIPDKR